MRKIVFIIGQGGAGKSTLVKYFWDNPIDGWMFFDFDVGGNEVPDTKDKEKIKEWVSKQRDFWTKKVYSDKYGNKNIVLFGVGLFPWKVEDKVKSLDDINFGYLDCDQKVHKERLIGRGDPHLWYEYQKNIDEIVEKLDKFGAKKINTDCSVEETARAIREWLEFL